MSWFDRQLTKTRNFFLEPVSKSNVQIPSGNNKVDANNLSHYPVRVALDRTTQDIMSWRRALEESERAILPFRIKMQQIYLDTVLNGHVFACIEKRKALTLLKDYHICDEKGVTDEYWTKVFKDRQFKLLLNYALDATFYGYTLINWTGIKDNKIQGVVPLRRWHISPDGLYYSSMMYAAQGIEFMNPEFKDNNGNSYYYNTLYVDTPNPHATSKCGFGILYQVALYEIFMRNNMGYNADFVEKFIMPMIWAKTSKREDHERTDLHNALAGMASSFVAVTDPTDDITIIESKNAGTGYNAYDNFENRCEKKVSKIILGHADAIDSKAGTLGSQQGKESEVAQALEDKSTIDSDMLEAVVNTDFFPKLRHEGVPLPENRFFQYRNDHEKEEYRRRVDESNKITAEIAKILKDSGLKMDESYFTERTGIPVTPIEEMAPNDSQEDAIKSVKNKLNELYNLTV